MLQTTIINCPTSHHVKVCVVLPVRKPLVHVHIYQHCQVMYVAHLGGLQGVDLEFGYCFFPEYVVTTLLKLLPQLDGVGNARPRGHLNLHMAIRKMFAWYQVDRDGETSFAESQGICAPMIG